MIYLLYAIVFGFLMTAVVGLLASWIDRKVTARVQYRVGPPLTQPLTDIIKLLGKETIVPKGASEIAFLGAPVLGLAGVILVSTLIWMNMLNPGESFIGDIIVAVYLLTIPSMSIIMGGFASRNPLASIGASREMKLVLSYELPFILAVAVPVIKSGYSIKLGEIISFQAAHGAFAGSWSGALALIIAVMCVQAKLGLVPFDAAEAETEIVSGVMIEYSGTALAIFRLMKNMLLCTLPFFLIILYLGGMKFGGVDFLWDALKYVLLVAVATVIRNTNPRVRVDQATGFFWGPMTVMGIAAVILAVKGF
ncbi:MAG: complex I subunit 1 family protein [Candidatus Omnitrophota bacterium]